MKSHDFATHEDYVKAQTTMTRRKSQWSTLFTDPAVIDAIADHHSSMVLFGVCHGVRCGEELDLFERAVGGHWVGTEICPDLCDGVRILHQDFSDVPDEWLGSMDIVYTNALDHARNPQETVAGWLKCLSTTGRLYVEWTKWSNKLGGGRNKADCFAATEEEHRDMFEAVGTVENVLALKTGRLQRKIFVIKGKH